MDKSAISHENRRFSKRFSKFLEAKMEGFRSQNAIKNQWKNQQNFECIFELNLGEKVLEVGEAVCRRWVPGICEFALGNTNLVTPCSPRGGRRIEDASRRHTAAPLPLG